MIKAFDRTEKALLTFIQNEVRRVGFEKVVLGLSGGIDSAVVAVLCAKALGKENVLGMMMPYTTTSQQSIDDANLLARTFNIPTEMRSIAQMVDAFFADQPEASTLRRGNVMARCRMITLYDISARDNRLVMGTSNKTELLLGYGTIFGDMASAINPIGDIYKTDMFRLAEKLGIPEQIITKKPTADLWMGQTDEQELGFSYEAADNILYQLIDCRQLPEDILANDSAVEPAVLKKIKHLVERSQYKRMMPVILKLSSRTVGIDFRYARDWNT